MDYATISELVSTARAPELGKPIANNTRAYRHPSGDVVLRLHSTDILTFTSDGSVRYDASGWTTTTTKQRFNAYGPDGYRVYSDRGQWRLYRFDRTGAGAPSASWPYADGITVHADGSVTGAGEDTARELARLRRAASTYARGYVAAMFAGEVPAPSGGDCWMCLMFTSPGAAPGSAGAEHIRSHIEERYYVPSLIVNAARELGASHAARAAIAELQSGIASGWAPVVRDQLVRLVRRYVTRELGISA